MFDWAETLRGLLSETYENDVLHEEEGEEQRQASASSILAAEGTEIRDVEFPCSGRTDWGREGGSGDVNGDRSAMDRAGERHVAEDEGFVEIVHGEAFTDRKSTFQAHLARVSSERQVNRYTHHGSTVQWGSRHGNFGHTAVSWIYTVMKI